MKYCSYCGNRITSEFFNDKNALNISLGLVENAFKAARKKFKSISIEDFGFYDSFKDNVYRFDFSFNITNVLDDVSKTHDAWKYIEKYIEQRVHKAFQFDNINKVHFTTMSNNYVIFIYTISEDYLYLSNTLDNDIMLLNKNFIVEYEDTPYFSLIIRRYKNNVKREFKEYLKDNDPDGGISGLPDHLFISYDDSKDALKIEHPDLDSEDMECVIQFINSNDEKYNFKKIIKTLLSVQSNVAHEYLLDRGINYNTI